MSGALAVGVLLVGEVRAAIALSALREVVPCPQTLAPLPAAAPGLLGAVDLRGLVVPVVDLRPLLGRPADRRGDQIVAVLDHDGLVLGLLADGALGVGLVPEGELQPVTAAHGELLFGHAFESPDDGAVVSVLDVGRLIALPGLPAARAVPRGTAAGRHDGRGAAGGTGGLEGAEHVVVRCGALTVALDVAHVHALLPSIDLTASPLDSALCLGTTPLAGRQVAAVDPLALTGLGTLPREEARGGLALRFGGPAGDGLVALLLTEVVTIAPVADAALLALPPLLAGVSGWFRGVTPLADVGDVLVLEPARLRGSADLAALAAVTIDPTATTAGVPSPRTSAEDAAHDGGDLATGADGRTDGDAEGRERAGGRYLTYLPGGPGDSPEVATPLLQVDEILPLPAAVTPVRGAEPACLGVFVHGRSVVPLVDLGALLAGVAGSRSGGDGGRVVVVDGGAGPVGFVVHALRAIEVSTWEEAPDAAGDPDGDPDGVTGAADAARRGHVVRVGTGGADRNLRTLDLSLVARTLMHTPAAVV